ncbi:MAG: zinc-binding dehydrogenase [Stellaceae bacterium]
MARDAVPTPGPGEAVLEAVCSAVSVGTERMWLDGSATALRSGRRSYPYRPGYALVGRIAETGAGFGVSRGARVFAMKPHGSHALLRHDDLWLPLSDDTGDDDALAIALTATALHAVARANLRPGDAAAVAGLGLLGLLLIQVLAATVAGPVVALTGSPAKLGAARAHGATLALRHDEPAGRLGELPPIRAWFECSGVAANVGRLMPLVRARGEIVLAGFYTETLALDGEAMFAGELTVKAVRSIGDGAERAANLRRAASLIASGQVRMPLVPAQRFAAEDFAAAYGLIADRDRSRATMRVVLEWR